MPIYEFYCPDNHKIYSFFARSLAYAGATPRCPENPKWRMERMISNFAVIGRAKEKPDVPKPDQIDNPKLDAAMMEMEHEFSHMNDDHPDPRQLARVMRKLTSLCGDKMVPVEMEEMIKRMEAGEDPDKLDEEYGNVMEGFDPLAGKDSEGDEEEVGIRARLQRLRRPPQRDPALYEMSEFAKLPAPPKKKRAVFRKS